MGTKGFFRIFGRVRGAQSKRGLPGLTVQALDKDLCVDDRLGTATTEAGGRFEIRYREADFRDFFDRKPDIYLQIRGADGALLHTTEDAVRYEAGSTEKFLIEVPETDERIADSEALRQRIVGDCALQTELAEAVGAALQDKALLDPALACTFVPVVARDDRATGGLFSAYLGPQPEPPDDWARGGMVGLNPQPQPPLPFADLAAIARAEPDPWVRPWWWMGLPAMELLRRLDRLRIMDMTATEGATPVHAGAALAYRIMADKALVGELARRVGTVLARHDLVLAPGMAYSFIPLVYRRPIFAGEVTAMHAAAPQVFDRAGRASAAGWVTPLDGIPPPDLLKALAGAR